MSGNVFYSSPFVPPEWIAAHGLIPQRVLSLPMDVAVGAGVCPIAAGFTQAARLWRAEDRPAPLANEKGRFLAGGAGPSSARNSAPNQAADNPSDSVIFTTTCDQMRRSSETIDAAGRLFLLNVPALWANPASRELYRQELLRLGRFLIGRGGRQPDQERLTAAMLEYDQRRLSQRMQPEVAANALRVALVGGPLRLGDDWIVRLLQSRGACVALDATETGQRTLPRPFNPARLAKDPVGELISADFDTIPDAFRRPLSMLHEYLTVALDRHRIQAVVLIRGIWCDLWHAQLSWLRHCGRPVAEVDLGTSASGAACDAARVRTRIEALLEAIR